MAMDNERDDLNKIYAAAIEKWLEAKRANADVETLRKLKLAMQKAHRNFVRGHENRRGRTQDVKMSSLLALLAAYLIGRYYQSRAERQKRGSGSLFSSTGTSRP